jgi:tetratricopeptide (TPR) repeat protein
MVVFGVLNIISSGYDYAAERLFYQAMKTYSKIAANPDASIPKMQIYVEKRLQKILTKYPKAEIAKEAHLTLAEFYITNKKYVQALSVLYDIFNSYSDDKIILSRAQFLKGSAYEKSNQWDKALREYRILRDRYTDSHLALRVPLYIGDYYRRNKMYAQANKAYQESVLYYKNLEKEERGQIPGYASANLLMYAYMELGQYEQAGKVVEDIINHYPKLLIFSHQLANIELIFIQQLRQPEKALEIYKNIRAKTDNCELKKELEQRIKAIEVQ